MEYNGLIQIGSEYLLIQKILTQRGKIIIRVCHFGDQRNPSLPLDGSQERRCRFTEAQDPGIGDIIAVFIAGDVTYPDIQEDMKKGPADPGSCILLAFDRINELREGGDLCQLIFDPVFQLGRDVRIIGQVGVLSRIKVYKRAQRRNHPQKSEAVC